MLKPEKRRHVRVIFTRTVKLTAGGRNFGDYAARNLSLSGLYIDGVAGVSLGEKCSLELRESGNQSSLIITFRAVVVRVDSGGIAVEFTDMEDDSFMFLQTMVLYASDDPIGIAKEFLEDFSQLTQKDGPRSACG